MADVREWLEAVGIQLRDEVETFLRRHNIAAVRDLGRLPEEGDLIADGDEADAVRDVMQAYRRAKLASAVERQMLAMELHKTTSASGHRRLSPNELLRFSCVPHVIAVNNDWHRAAPQSTSPSPSKSRFSLADISIKATKQKSRPPPHIVSDITYQYFQCTKQAVTGPQLQLVLRELKKSPNGNYTSNLFRASASGMKRVPQSLDHDDEFAGGARRRRSVSHGNGGALYGWTETENLLQEALEFATNAPRDHADSPRRLRNAIKAAQTRGFKSKSLSEATALLDNLVRDGSPTTSQDSSFSSMSSSSSASDELPGNESSFGSPQLQTPPPRRVTEVTVDDVPVSDALPNEINEARRKRQLEVHKEVDEYILALIAEGDNKRKEAATKSKRPSFSRNPSSPQLSETGGDENSRIFNRPMSLASVLKARRAASQSPRAHKSPTRNRSKKEHNRRSSRSPDQSKSPTWRAASDGSDADHSTSPHGSKSHRNRSRRSRVRKEIRALHSYVKSTQSSEGSSPDETATSPGSESDEWQDTQTMAAPNEIQKHMDTLI